ncbi:MAG: alpha/beta fold hydrolase [Rhizomicrobium sp.]
MPGRIRISLTVIFLALFASPAWAGGGFIKSGGASIHFLDVGQRGGAHTLVLIPGWSASASVWREQIAHFSPAWRVVAIDPRSQGDSSKTDDGNTPTQRAHDYEAVFATLKLRHIVLVGWSQGVQDVASYVDRFGTKRLDAIVLVDATISRGASSVSANPKFVRSLLDNIDLYARHKREYLQGMMHAIYTRKMSDAEFQVLVNIGMKTPTNTGMAELNADMLGADLTPALAKFDKPTLVVASAGSFELAQQKAEAAHLPRGSFVQIENAGHGVFVDQPQIFDRTLEAFLKRLPD